MVFNLCLTLGLMLPCYCAIAIVYIYALCIADTNSSGVIAGVVVAVVVVTVVVVVLIVGALWLIQRNKPEKSGIAHFHTHEPEPVYSHINAQLPSPNGMRDIPGHIEKDDTESVGPAPSTIREGDKNFDSEENPYSLSAGNVHLSEKPSDEHATVWITSKNN